MGIETPAKVKYELIEAAAMKNSYLTITTLCEIAGVSRSGYYSWIKQAERRRKKEERDQADFELILEAYKYRGYAKGARSINMRLLRQDPPVNMNVKKIRRLMKKYGLKCPFRKPNPYRQSMREAQAGITAPNLVNREFNKHGVRSILLTDITYLFYKKERCYLSVIKDAYTREVLAYELSKTMETDFVKDTVIQMEKKHHIPLNWYTIIHSDQGPQYKSKKFIDIINDYELRQSMSRKANCWDNAPQESFFGHMKDEIDISHCCYFEEVKTLIDDYMDYYNNERYQWDLAKLAPAEFYQYDVTGSYPLEGIVPKCSWGSAPDPEV